jgi:hypothetical protein
MSASFQELNHDSRMIGRDFSQSAIDCAERSTAREAARPVKGCVPRCNLAIDVQSPRHDAEASAIHEGVSIPRAANHDLLMAMSPQRRRTCPKIRVGTLFIAFASLQVALQPASHIASLH